MRTSAAASVQVAEVAPVKGPVFCLFGNRIRYRRDDLEAWAATRRRASTVDDGTVLPGATP